MQDEITLLMFRLDFQYVRIAILKPAYEYQTALGRSKEYPSATLRPRCYHICLPRELSLSLSLSTRCVLALSCALIPARRRAPVAPSFRGGPFQGTFWIGPVPGRS